MNIAQRYRQLKEQSSKENLLPASCPMEQKIIDITKFKSIENDTITKIHKTPYWNDYNYKTQENMISKYFDSKIKREGTDFSKDEKESFVKNILKIVNG